MIGETGRIARMLSSNERSERTEEEIDKRKRAERKQQSRRHDDARARRLRAPESRVPSQLD